MLPIAQRYLQQGRLSLAYPVLSIGLLLLVTSACFVACGSNAASGGSPNPTSTSTKSVQKCGSIQLRPGGTAVNQADVKQAEECFWQAYQKCQAASLSFTTTGVDTILLRTFTVKNSGQQCSVNDAVQHAIVPAPLSKPRTYTCTGVNEMADGLHFSACGDDGDVVVPLQPGA